MNKKILLLIWKTLKYVFTGICVFDFAVSLYVAFVDTFNLYDITTYNNIIHFCGMHFDYIVVSALIAVLSIPICAIALIAEIIRIIFNRKKKAEYTFFGIIVITILLVLNILSTLFILSFYLIKFGV